MRRSRKFSNRRHDKDMLLYFMCIIALIQIFYLIIRKKYTSLLFFCIVGVLLNLFIKNISLVLLLDILITNILMRTVIRREGFDQPTTTTDTKPETPLESPSDKTDKKKKLPATPATVEDASAAKPDASTTTPATTAPATPTIESFTNNDKKLQGVNKSIQMLSNLMDKFSSISGQLNYN